MLEKVIGLDFGQIVELTATAVILYLLVKNADGFSRTVKALSDSYVSGVKALQGR